MIRLKELRKQKGDTLESLSKNLKEKFDLSLSTGQLSNYENENRTPRDTKIWDCIADYFGVPVGYLLGYTDYKNTDEYFEENKEAFSIDVDILNSIDTIGEKNLHVVRNFLKKEFIKEYSQVDENGGDWGDWDKETAVRVAMGNVNENLWGLPDSVVKLILYWSTLKESEQDSLIGIIKVLSSYNLAKYSPPED